ncbi:MAG: twin-arginine translocase TatA/TatE family subunit [Bdellovibrionales bacterium]
MFDVGWPELLLVGAIALLAIGPQDLPKAMHKLGLYAGKLRRFLHGIQHDFDRLMHEAEEIEKTKDRDEKDEHD